MKNACKVNGNITDPKGAAHPWRGRPVVGLALCLSLAAVPVSRAGAMNPNHTPRFSGAPVDAQPVYSATEAVRAFSSVELVSEDYSGPVRVVFTELSMTPAPGSELTRVSYALYGANGLRRLSTTGSPAGEQETLGGSFPPKSKKGDRLNLGFLVEIAPTSMPPPGIHVISLWADLYAGEYPPSGAPVDSVMFTISVRVGAHYDVSIVPSGAVFSLSATSATMDFGVLKSNDARGMDILVKSNISFALSIGSVNGGAFVNASDGYRIPYSLSANGIAVLLTPGGSAVVGDGARASYGIPARFAVVVTVLPIEDMPTEGAYSDLIMVTLSAR